MLRSIVSLSRACGTHLPSTLVCRCLGTQRPPPSLPTITTANLTTPTSADISDALAHLHDRKTHVLYPLAKEDLDVFLRVCFPEKCNIRTLTAVFNAFATDWQQGLTDLYFEYDGFMWRSTIRSETSGYAGCRVAFTNIKLPNDGFFYTSDYSNGGALVEMDATSIFIENLQCFVANNNLLKGEPGEIEAKYFEKQQRLAVYFWNAERDACVTIKFEYGWHEGAKNQQAGHFMAILQKWKEGRK